MKTKQEWEILLKLSLTDGDVKYLNECAESAKNQNRELIIETYGNNSKLSCILGKTIN